MNYKYGIIIQYGKDWSNKQTACGGAMFKIMFWLGMYN